MPATSNGGKALIRRASDGKYLVLRTNEWSENPERSRAYDLPGGMCEPGETPEQCSAREVREEAGVSVQPDDLLLVYAHSFLRSDGHSGYNRFIYFVEVPGQPAITLSWEHESHMWLTSAEVLALDVRQPYPAAFRHMAAIGVLV